jgi:hypothetical protein
MRSHRSKRSGKQRHFLIRMYHNQAGCFHRATQTLYGINSHVWKTVKSFSQYGTTEKIKFILKQFIPIKLIQAEMFPICMREMPGSKLGMAGRHRMSSCFAWVSSDLPGKCWDSILNPLQMLSNGSFIIIQYTTL